MIPASSNSPTHCVQQALAASRWLGTLWLCLLGCAEATPTEASGSETGPSATGPIADDTRPPAAVVEPAPVPPQPAPRVDAGPSLPNPGNLLPQPNAQCGPQGEEFRQLVERLNESLKPVPPLQCGLPIWTAESTSLQVQGLSPTRGRLRYFKRLEQMTPGEKTLVQAIRRATPWQLCPAEGTHWTVATQTRAVQTAQFVSQLDNVRCGDDGDFVDVWALEELMQWAGCWFSEERSAGLDAASAPRVVANSGCDYPIALPPVDPSARRWLEVQFPQAGTYLIESSNCSASAMILALHDPQLASEGVESPAAVSLPTACATLQFELRQPTVLSVSTQLLSANSASAYALTISRVDP